MSIFDQDQNTSVKVQNKFYEIEIDRQHGLIRRIFDKIGHLDLINEPRLADNFALVVPLPDMQANFILGKEQRLNSIEEVENGVILHWGSPLTNTQGNFDLDVVMSIELGDSIQFKLDVHNHTSYQVAEVWYPILGGITGLGNRLDTQVMIGQAGASSNVDMFQKFRGQGIEELGVPGPEYRFKYPGGMPMPWMDIYNPKLKRGLYLACHDLVARFKALRFILLPGNAPSRMDTWPRPDEVPDTIPVGLVGNWVCFPYTPPGSAFEGPPVELQFHDGDWHQAAQIYREWFTAHFKLTDPQKSWLHQVMAFQDTMFLLPEGNLILTFKDIPRWARDALEYGVKAVMISGWQLGGHDNQYPRYEPDPRLGTWDELAEAIRECHQMGIRVFFFANFQPVDCDTDWYRQELHRYRSMDPWGCSVPMGWGMGTMAARMSITRRPNVFASPSFPEYRQIIVAYMKKLAEIGADGVHLDKLAWAIVTLDFNPDLKVSPDRAEWEGIIQGVEEILETCQAINPEFCLSYEGVWDRLLPYTDVIWAWHDPLVIDHVAVFKYTFPQWMPSIVVWQPFDYNVVNNALRFGYQLYVTPATHLASMADPPARQLSAYIREILRLREELKDTIYLGEFLDVLEVQVEAHADIKFNTFRNPKTGKRACVLVNFGEGDHEASVAFSGNGQSAVRIYQPFKEPKSVQAPVSVKIPPERPVIAVEE